MSSRERILAAIKQNQPEPSALPGLNDLSGNMPSTIAAYRKVLEALGGTVFEINNVEDIPNILKAQYPELTRIADAREKSPSWANEDPHMLENVDMAIVQGQWGVAENGAIWLAEEDLQVRVLPFICQHLSIVLKADKILATMHDAYDVIGTINTGFGVFIAGPSKTADIEQSLVLGAHGAKSLAVFILI
ncbi:lactate utilization protein B/C [Chitinophaga silvatica]|uniref:Lactate utilization protein B/C n=1 Tax=Chitinophaga silvatica TaxID=2282649 RepID=A0A3E1Y9D7_9BACT|nr:LUD domain-containing protein [Chitinophaga silvatica]RFS22013.1 lactate utilization protein B/C [Chitinophaga silvatica]